MDEKDLPIIIKGEFKGRNNGSFVGSEAIKVLNTLKSLGIESIQYECNKVLSEHRDRWKLMPPDNNVDELGFPIKFREALREVARPFTLSAPDSILVVVEDTRAEENQLAGAATDFNNGDIRNPIVTIFLPNLEIKGSTITWKGFQDPFHTLILHEFLHTCGDPPLGSEIPDSIIRLNHIGEEAIRNLRKDISF